MVVVEINDPIYMKKYGKPITYYMEKWIKHSLDTKVIPDLQKKDKDCIIAFDGKEGTGKSTLAIQWCKYVDPSFCLERVVFTPDEFREAIYKAKKGQAILFDEAFTGFSSRSALSGVNRTLVSLMMQVRQKNLFIGIVLPTFFLLDKYISLFRTRVLVHVYETKSGRGYFRVFSKDKKRQLVMDKGARTYSYGIKTKLKGKFRGVFALGDEDMEKKYRDKKIKALDETEKNPMSTGQVKHREQRNIMLYILRKQLKLSYREMETLLLEYDFDISFRQIATICAKYGEKDKEGEFESDKLDKGSETESNSSKNEEITPEISQIEEDF